MINILEIERQIEEWIKDSSNSLPITVVNSIELYLKDKQCDLNRNYKITDKTIEKLQIVISQHLIEILKLVKSDDYIRKEQLIDSINSRCKTNEIRIEFKRQRTVITNCFEVKEKYQIIKLAKELDIWFRIYLTLNGRYDFGDNISKKVFISSLISSKQKLNNNLNSWSGLYTDFSDNAIPIYEELPQFSINDNFNFQDYKNPFIDYCDNLYHDRINLELISNFNKGKYDSENLKEIKIANPNICDKIDSDFQKYFKFQMLFALTFLFEQYLKSIINQSSSVNIGSRKLNDNIITKYTDTLPVEYADLRTALRYYTKSTGNLRNRMAHLVNININLPKCEIDKIYNFIKFCYFILAKFSNQYSYKLQINDVIDSSELDYIREISNKYKDQNYRLHNCKIDVYANQIASKLGRQCTKNEINDISSALIKLSLQQEENLLLDLNLTSKSLEVYGNVDNSNCNILALSVQALIIEKVIINSLQKNNIYDVIVIGQSNFEYKMFDLDSERNNTLLTQNNLNRIFEICGGGDVEIFKELLCFIEKVRNNIAHGRFLEFAPYAKDIFNTLSYFKQQLIESQGARN